MQANDGREDILMNRNPIPPSFAGDHQVDCEALAFSPYAAGGEEDSLRPVQRFQATLRGWLAPISLVSLLSLSRELANLLVAVQPRPEFRAALRRSLLARARQQYAQHLLFTPEPDGDGHLARLPGWWRGGERLTGKHLALGAVAVGSAVSLVSILALTVRHYRRQAASSPGAGLGTM